MTHYKVQVIQKYIETYVVEADSKQEAEKITYEGDLVPENCHYAEVTCEDEEEEDD